MSTTLSDIRTITRYAINDIIKSGSDMFTYTTSSVFTLTESNVVSVTDVAVNDVTSSVTYTYNSTLNKVTVSSSLTTGDIVEISHTYYNNYSNDELDSYINNAIMHLSINKYYDFQVVSNTVYPELNDGEKHLIAAIAAVLINPDNKSIRTPDLTVTIPSGHKTMPTFDIIRKMIAIYKKSNTGVIAII